MARATLLGTYINGNTRNAIYSDGTRICETDDDEFRFAYARNMDIKICNRCSMGCTYCHEGSTPDGALGDILNEKFIETLHPYQEIAIGGGDALSHPDLMEFLARLKQKKVIANITVNQNHFMMQRNFDFIKILVDNHLIYGLGISLMNPTQEFIEKVKMFPNAVIHVINGVLTKDQLDILLNNNLKMLILGYKNLRRGADFLSSNIESIAANQQMLYNELPNILPKFNVVSFDNLAIEQLDVQRLLTEDEWNDFYQGDDGTSTYYIDMVERKFARSSTADFDKRYDLLDSVDDMFNVIINEGR